MTIVRSIGLDAVDTADTAAPDWDGGSGSLVAGPASGDAGYGLTCFSCGKSGHGVSRCPKMNVSFPYLLPRWTAEKVGSSYVMISPRVTAERLLAENGD